jgi:hypothetical protein
MPTAILPERLPRMSSQEAAEYRARQDAVIAAGVANIQREQKKLIRLGILDADGNLVGPFVPPLGSSGQNYDAEG